MTNDTPHELTDLSAYVAATAKLQGLDLPPERLEAVMRQFSLLAEMAEKTRGIDLPAEQEAAPVYRP